MATCTACNAAISDKYCSACGRAAQLTRIDWHYIYHELTHLFHVETGFFYTVKELALRPGDTVRTFITRDRSKLVKPIVFTIVAALIAKLVSHLLMDESAPHRNYEKEFGHAYAVVLEWIGTNSGYANLIYGFLLAFPLRLAFRKYGYNVFELMVLLSYLLALVSLVYALFSVLFFQVDADWLKPVLGVPTVGYLVWGIGQFFDKRKPMVYARALLALLLGYVFWQVIIILVSDAVDYGVELFGKH